MKDFISVLKDVKAIGYDGVGLETRLLPLQAIKNPSIVKETLGKVGVDNAGSYSPMKDKDVGWAAEAGSPLIWVVARGEWTFEAAASAVDRLASMADESGIKVAVHNHLGTRFETEQQMRKLLDSNSKLYVCYDTAHAEAAKIDSEKFIHDYGDRIALVHVKDLRARIPKDKVSITRDFVNIGEGIVDFRMIFSALKDAGYEGYLMLETEAVKGRKPSELARKGLILMRNLLKSA